MNYLKKLMELIVMQQSKEKLKKSLGQNFLKDENILKKEASFMFGKVLEIGAGKGALTKHLARNKKIDELIVVEIDKRFKDELSKYTDKILLEDFLKIEPFEVDCIVGNIPYYISSKIIFRLKDWKFKIALLIVQKEFANAMLAKPNEKKYTRLSVMSQANFYIKKIQDIPKHLFYPVPKVDSTMILLEKKDEEIDEELVRILFSHKNKTLKKIGKIYGFDVPKEWEDKRPRAMSIEELKELSKTINLQNSQKEGR